DFGDVRVHADLDAAGAAEALHAHAYAYGSHLVFGPGQYAPATTTGRSLLAHELAHVVQQRRGGAAPGLADGPGALDRAADAAAGAIGLDRPVLVQGHSGRGLVIKGKEELSAHDYMVAFTAN